MGAAVVNLNRGFKIDSSEYGAVPLYAPSGEDANIFFTSAMEHELGHALGLTEPAGTTDSTNWCQYTGAPSIMNGVCGQNDLGDGGYPGGKEPALPTQCDKNVQSQSESMGKTNGPIAGGTTGGGSGGGLGSGTGTCSPTGQPPYVPPNTGAEYVWSTTSCTWVLEPCSVAGCASPIVIDTDGTGFRLTAPSKGIIFDFFGDGQPIQIAWTAEGSTNGWLALDRNGNGLIDSARELFGNVTPQASSDQPNGFSALAVFDEIENGGNGDGVIDKRDAVWGKLTVWIDSNHDGISQPGELHSLDEVGIHSIELSYATSWRTDRFGNKFRFRGTLNPDRGDDVGRSIYDVFLAQ